MKIFIYTIIGISVIIIWCLLGILCYDFLCSITKDAPEKYKLLRFLFLLLGPIGLVLSILYFFIMCIIGFVLH